MICQAAIGKGKNKLLVRGTDGAQWVFCPAVKSMKRDRISTDRCQGCKHFVRFKQTSSPQKTAKKKPVFFRMTTARGTFQNTRTLSQARATRPPATLFPHIPSLTKEKQPLLDIFEEQNHLIVLAELPGIDEKDLNVKTDEASLTISTDNKTPKYLKKVHLPTTIKKDTIKSTYKNNILQIKLKKLNTISHA